MKKIAIVTFAVAVAGSAFAFSPFWQGVSGIARLLMSGGVQPCEPYEPVCREPPAKPAFPAAEDAKTESDFLVNVAAPFYRRHIVETYDAAAETNEAVRTRVIAVREALARHLTTLDRFYPDDASVNAANELWGMGVHDAAAALVRYDGNTADFRYWQGEGQFAEARKAIDPKREPILAMLLERRAFAGLRDHHKNWPRQKPESLVAAAYKLYDAAFGDEVVGILKEADPRIAEWMDMEHALPVGSAEKLGNEYLGCCQRAVACKDDAFAARGTGWASEVTEEGWKGWEANNRVAESNLLRAVELKPDRARAPMLLADLYGRSCGNGDPIAWMNRGVSNSLDEAEHCAFGAVHFQMSRWGGGRNGLRNIVIAATTDVNPRSTFALSVAAYAIGRMIEYNNEGAVREEVYRRAIDPELRARLFAMIDTYVAAGELPCMPRPDLYRQCGLTLALVTGEWERARKYRGEMTAGVSSEWEQFWVRYALAREESVFYWNLLELLGERSREEALGIIDAEQAISEGRHAEAASTYGAILAGSGLSRAAEVAAGGRAFLARVRSDQAKGGWVDLMPTATSGEARLFWGKLATQADGWARKTSDWRSHYMPMCGVPGIGSVFEATIRFEPPRPNQKDWHITWGWARPYTCNGSSWAFPAISFCRDEKGDHVGIAAFTRENKERDAPEGEHYGTSPTRMVYEGELEKRDDHTFRATFEKMNGDFFVEIDGKEVYRQTMESLMEIRYQNERVQPNGNVFPVWKLYDQTAFRDYRYRRLGSDTRDDGK